MYKILKDFFKDSLLFTTIYIFAAAFIIAYYQMTASEVKLLYPILIAAFFYCLYMIIRFWSYYTHQKALERLGENAVAVNSSLHEYQRVYDTLYKVYKHFGSKLSALTQKESDNRRFISAYIHNLKTPVTVSSIITQRVNKGELEAEEALNQIDAELQRLTENLNTLLELQRLKELSNDYEPKQVDLEAELERIINNNKSLFINSHVYPKVERTDENLQRRDSEIVDAVNSKDVGRFPVYTDCKWNEVLLNQLISNAVKYSRLSGVERNGEDAAKYIHFSFRCTGKFVELSIHDEGIGIPEYDLPRVFDAFFTGENGRAGFNSSGIGLYLCKQICESLNQTIRIENDNGCLVTITYLSVL